MLAQQGFQTCFQRPLRRTVGVLWVFPQPCLRVCQFGLDTWKDSFSINVKRPGCNADLLGGAGGCEVGPKHRLHSIMAGLAARQLKPPMQQVRMPVQNEQALSRLQKSTCSKHEFDIIDGSAYRAKLARQRTGEPAATILGSQPNSEVTIHRRPDVQTCRLRVGSWKVVC